VIYGGGGSIGGGVARAFGREGARVFLAGRTRPKLAKVAEEIRSAGGVAETAEVDALKREGGRRACRGATGSRRLREVQFAA
jgi:3-oxoacyl-[acyl-carrier protein] reductase